MLLSPVRGSSRHSGRRRLPASNLHQSKKNPSASVSNVRLPCLFVEAAALEVPESRLEVLLNSRVPVLVGDVAVL